MTSTPPPKAYIDTMVLVYFFKMHRLTSRAKKFFTDIENGKYVGLVTSFTIAEFIAVMRTALCQARRKPSTYADAVKLRKEIEGFIEKMGLILFDADKLASDLYMNPLFSAAEEVIENARPYENPRSRRWFLVNGADALHVVLATRAGADIYATFDDDFRGVDAWIRPLMLFEVYHK